jgi:hypothetical protein
VEYSSAESNRVGFEAANTSGGLTVIDSTFDRNRAGVVVESDTTELLLPQVGTVIAGNTVSDNENPDTPTTSEDADVFGYGIAVGGGADDQVLRNRVTANSSVGIIVTAAAGYAPKDNLVSGNALTGNRVDLVYTAGNASPIAGNCFTANDFTTSQPPAIDTTMACGSSGTVKSSFTGATAPDGVDYSSVHAPAAQAGMPTPGTQRPQPATNEPPAVDLPAVTLPGS